MRNTTIPLLAIAIGACGTGDGPKADPAPAATTSAPSTEEHIETKARNYDVHRWFPGDRADTLLANMITFIFKRPTEAINRDRADPAFRSYYVDKLPLFQYVFHQMAPDSTHWFYLVRPARSVEGDKRGVGGRLRTNERLELVEFEEVFNTPVLPEEELRAIGLMLFEEMVATGNVDRHLNDRQLVEWPDDRLKYSQEKREWRYDVE